MKISEEVIKLQQLCHRYENERNLLMTLCKRLIQSWKSEEQSKRNIEALEVAMKSIREEDLKKANENHRR